MPAQSVKELLWRIVRRLSNIRPSTRRVHHSRGDELPFASGRLKSLGRQGERAAYRFLRKQGYRIVARNFSTFSGEIDLVGWDRDILCFVEVKSRTTQEHGRPEEAVHAFKQRQILNTALDFLRQANLHSVNTRFDIVSVLYPAGGKTPQCRLIRRAFGGASR